ncbi:MAG: 6-hydroxycyclohex-1-ene-1-carbonyl-CoA dehydrogenase [Sandaracinaceae bacterium]|nr:6-hydroxycyclohex-1-ene-1-carbonyl-CoA dehydrogenase [Sandaracinaceae bacterium]
MQVQAWQMVAPGAPLERVAREVDERALPGDRVLVEVAGCGVCHTDLGFLYEGVRTRHPLPLTLGHEIAGRVVAAGADGADLLGRAVVVPAVVPCGRCDACRAGRGAICPRQFFPGNDDHGGFASHVVVPSRGLSVVDEARLAAANVSLASLSVVADAVSTPYQAIVDAGLAPGDLAVFVGAGGVGGFGVQLAAALGARVVALDVDAGRLDRLLGATLRLDAAGDPRAIRGHVADFAKREGVGSRGWRIFETSGSPKGQELAFGLLGPGAHLGVVGFTREKVSVRLSNLMAFDATARGTWGCAPEHYPAIVELVLSGRVVLGPFVEERSLGDAPRVLEALRRHELTRRPVLVPDFDREESER